MGNLLGDYWEYIALSNYNLKRAHSGADGYDGITAEGLKVQIKANHSSSTIGFRGEADLLLVLKIESSAEWQELYYGPFKTSQGESNLLEMRQQVHDPGCKASGPSQAQVLN